MHPRAVAWLQLVLLQLAQLLHDSDGGPIRVVDIDPTNTGTCPGPFSLATGIGGEQLCVRSAFPSSSLAATGTAAAFVSAGNSKGLRRYVRITGSVKAYQKGSMDAFAVDFRDSSSLESSDYVDGMSITVGHPRTHVFTLAVGASYDTNLGTSGMCPCGAGTQSLACGGSAAPSFLSASGSVVCDSGNYGTISSAWEPREMQASFDVILAAETNDDVEVRLLADTQAANEDIGILRLIIDIHELEDAVAPMLQLVGAQTMNLVWGVPFVDPGATCVDNLDGTLEPNVSAALDVFSLGVQQLDYSCEDSHANSANLTRVFFVTDQGVPAITLNGEPRICLTQGYSYDEYGASCNDAIEGLFLASITGQVDTEVAGSYTLTYLCMDTSGNNDTALRSVLVVGGAMPGNLSLESFSLQVGSGGTSTTFGSKSNASNVDPQTDFNLLWSESVSPGGEGCRLISIYELSANEASAAEPVLVKSYEGVDLLSRAGALSGSQLTIAQGSDVTLHASLKDQTAYKLVVEEYIVLDVGGEGNARQVVAFTTGDFTEPHLLSSSPAAGDLAWPLSRGITLTFSEAVVANASGLHLRLKRVANSTVENVPCDGSASSSGLRLNIQGSQVQLEGLASVWYACADFQLDADAGCLEDTSVNRNPSSAVPVLQFVTSCVTALSPANDSFQVAMDSQIVLTFSEAVQLAPGGIAYGVSITLEPLGEAARQLGVDDYPFVYASGRDVTIDLACSSKRCKIFAEAAGLSVSTLGLCTGRALQNCRGKVHQVRVGPGAVLRASGAAWPGTSLLSSAGLNGTGAMAAQFVADPYTFTLRLADMTPPKMLLVDATAVSEATVAVKVQLDESGSVFCAAWGGTDGDSCDDDIVLLEQYSENGTCDTNRTTCTDCDPPSFGCFNRTVMWIDDGCQGKFSLKGYELECMSRELDTTIHDGAYKSVLSLGHRHACALQKHTVDTDASCWGKADYIEPVTGLPAAGSFSSISVGFQHTCAVRSVTGSIVCWGTNSFGETDGPAGGGVFWAVTSGYRFSCALYDDTRTVACWGQNGQGQATPPVGVVFLQISAGDGHVCGVRPSDYTAQCWGGNTDGQSTPPAGVAFLARSIGTSVLPHGSLSSGWHHTCGVRSLDGGVTCWGQNTDGQTNAPQDSTFVLVASGRAHSCGLEKAAAGATERKGTVRCWGLNDLGQSSPPLTLPKLSALSTGDDFTCGLALEDGEPFCWGKNDYLQSQPPFALRFGLPDEFITASCALETRPSSRRIRSASGKGDAAATVVTSYDSALGYAEANLLLGGLLEGKTYGVYCTAQDAELPTPNTVNEARVATAGRSVTMPDRTPPTLVVLDAVPSATQGGVLLLTLQLSEPLLKVFCTAVRDREPAPSGREIIASVTAASGFGQAVAGSLTLEVRLQYLAFDQEYDVYCTAQDPAGNWATEASVLRTKMDVHTLFDVTSPRLLSTVPVDGGYAVCAADGGTAGCVTTLRFLFDEDVQRGTGNFSLVCLSNIGYCEDVDVPVDLHTSATGSVTFLGQSLLVQFSQPLVDASQFKVVLSAGAVADLSGNPYALDSTCAAWLPTGAALTGACVDTFSFSTPS